MSSVATPASWLFSIINGARNGFFYGIAQPAVYELAAELSYNPKDPEKSLGEAFTANRIYERSSSISRTICIARPPST